MDTHLVLFVHATMAQCSHKCPVRTKKHAHSSNYGKKLLPLLLSRKCIWQMEIHSPAAVAACKYTTSFPAPDFLGWMGGAFSI